MERHAPLRAIHPPVTFIPPAKDDEETELLTKEPPVMERPLDEDSPPVDMPPEKVDVEAPLRKIESVPTFSPPCTSTLPVNVDEASPLFATKRFPFTESGAPGVDVAIPTFPF